MPFIKRVVLLFSILAVISCGESNQTNSPLAVERDRVSDGIYYSLSNDVMKTLSECDVGPDELDRLISLSYRDFDQDFNGGWRQVSSTDSCAKAGQMIIELYILYSGNYSERDLKYLRWHAGQEAAEHDNYQACLSWQMLTSHYG